MEDEITKHGKKIYKKAVSKEHSMFEKIKDIIIEILIIVFAITLSIWFHSWSEHRHNQEDAMGFLGDLKTDLTSDIVSIKDSKQNLEKNIKSLKSNDSVNKTVSILTMLNNGNFEGFKSSGKIGYIDNKDLRISILSYYGKTYLGLHSHDNLSNEYLNTLNIRDVSNLSNQQIDRIKENYVTEAQRNIAHYDRAVKEIESIIKQIDTELAE